MKYTIEKETTLMNFLLTQFSRTQVKLQLKYKQVYVNDSNMIKFDTILHVKDVVEVNKDKKIETNLNIIYEDKDLIV
ncbi:MAG: RluA family pseudouridine synthase, partial [Erysipelotrichaceae bacterium]